jgi:hypothetical protein
MDQKQAELALKIETETKILEGALYVLPKLKGMQAEQCQETINEQRKRIAFLRNEQSNSKRTKSDQTLFRKSLFSYLTQDTPLTSEKLQFLRFKAQKRLDSEILLKEGFLKFIEGENFRHDAKERLEEVNAKIFILSRALQQYDAIDIGANDAVFDNTPERVSGKLTIRVMDHSGIASSRKKRNTIALSIDRGEKFELKTKSARAVPLSSAQEIELCVIEEGYGILAYIFFPIIDFVREVNHGAEASKNVVLELLPNGKLHVEISYSDEILK